MYFSMEEADYNYDVFRQKTYELFTNRHFIEDAQKDYDLGEIEHNPLTEKDKNSILSYLESISDKILNRSYDEPYAIQAYKYLIEEKRKHVDSDFDFIPDDFIQKCCERCERFCYSQPFIPVYGALFEVFKEKCRTPGQMPKIVRKIHTPHTWTFNKFNKCVNSDGSYNLEGTGIYFE